MDYEKHLTQRFKIALTSLLYDIEAECEDRLESFVDVSARAGAMARIMRFHQAQFRDLVQAAESGEARRAARTDR